MVKLVIASLLIPIGFLFGLAVATEYINPRGTDEDRASVVIAAVFLGLPAFIMGTGLIWQEYTQFSRKLAAKQRRINAIFKYLLAQNNGIISVSLFMQKVNISSPDAQRFLDQQVILHPGSNKYYKNNNIYYCFNLKSIENTN